MGDTVRLDLRVIVRPWARAVLAIAYRAPWACAWVGAERLGCFIGRHGVRIVAK